MARALATKTDPLLFIKQSPKLMYSRLLSLSSAFQNEFICLIKLLKLIWGVHKKKWIAVVYFSHPFGAHFSKRIIIKVNDPQSTVISAGFGYQKQMKKKNKDDIIKCHLQPKLANPGKSQNPYWLFSMYIFFTSRSDFFIFYSKIRTISYSDIFLTSSL